MMVLKRLFVVALSALGLGALATGPAFADDDQIPAPRLYGDISSCAGGMLPTASTAMGMNSLLGMGGVLDQAFDSGAAAGIQMDYTQDDALLLTDALVTSLGSGTNETDDLLELLSVSNCNNPVANNVSQAGTLYNDYVSAKKAFEALEEPDAEDTAAFNTARMNKDDFGGDVYNTVYDQQAKLSAANKAIADYNKLAGSMGSLATLKHNQTPAGGMGGYDDIVINVSSDGSTARTDTIRITDLELAPTEADGSTPLTGNDKTNNINAQAAPVYGSGNTAGYRAIAGNNTAGDTAAVVTASSGAAFNDAGALQFDVGNQAAGVNTDVVARASTAIDTLGEIVHELDRWQAAVDAADEALTDAQEAGNLDTRTQEETLRRATLGRDHVQGELDRLTRVVRSQNLDITANQITISTDPNTTDDDVTYENERDLVDAYLGSRSNVVAAADKVRAAVRSLDSANRALQSKLQDPDGYLNQLVTLREYQQMEAMNALEEAGGEDALQSFKDAVEDAGKAVTAAKAQRMAHQTLTSEPGSTTSKLLDALLEPGEIDGEANPADDDGLALVSAIAEVDGKIADVAQNIQNVEDLAGPVAANTEAIAENAEDITALDGRVAANEAEIGMDENGMSRIDHNEARSMANATMITTNAENIATNATNIMTNASEIMRVEGRVDTNWDAIAENQMAISDNASSISSNADAIAANMNSIGQNASAIGDNRNMIGELSDSLEVVRAGVAASMALAGMPAINGRGISIGVGSYDGESAFAVGFQIQGEMASFKVGVTSAGGETGASAGVGFQF